MLSGDVARLYYVQAENEAAEKCVLHGRGRLLDRIAGDAASFYAEVR